jgi:surface antigen
MKGKTSNKVNWLIIVLMVLGAVLTSAPSGQSDLTTASYLENNCTWWAAKRAGETGWFAFPQNLGHAGNWDNNAPGHYLERGDVARGGAIAVWEGVDKNQDGQLTYPEDDNLGHVAFVEEVYTDGKIRISEYNYANASIGCYAHQKCYRTLPTQGSLPDSYIYPPDPIVYEHANYAGHWRYVYNDFLDLFNTPFTYPDSSVMMGDRISSIWIPRTHSLVLWKDKNFGVAAKILDASDPDFADDTFSDGSSLNDNASSIMNYKYSCGGGGYGIAVAGVSVLSETAIGNFEGPPIEMESQLTTADVNAQTYSGICGTGSTNPSTPPGAGGQPDHTQWRVSYYNNEGTVGSPVWSGTDGTGGIGHNWGTGSPASGVNADHFSARWERDVNFPTSGDWKFTIRSDDGFRIFIDGELFSHEWSAGWHDISPSKYLTAGVHRIRLDYFDATGGAQVSFSWQGPPNNDGNNHGSWFAEWFNWDDLDPAKRISTSSENQINYDWHEGSPGHGLGADNFSVRWTGTFYFDEDWFYKFPVKSDDGFKLWIDGQLVGQEWYEGWHDVAPDRRLSAGNHQVVYEYFEKYGGANTRLTWYKLPPDTTPPVGQIIQPAGGITINANQVKICAQVEDAGVGLGTVQFQLYHLAEPDAWRVLGNDDDGRDGYCKTWDHSQWPDEEINTYIFAWDRAGNMLSGGGNTFRIDRTAPTGSFASPTSNSTITTNNLTIRVNANDNLSNGVDRVEFQGYYDAGNDNLGWWPMTVDSTGADGWGFDWDLSDLPNQTITMRATIYDKAGNSRTIEANNVAIVPRPPSEHVELTNVSTQVSGEYRTEFNPGESFSLWIGATNHVAEPVDTLWTWEVTNPNGSVNGGLSWKDFPVSMSPGANAWALNRTAPTTPGTYTFVGKITWGDGQYQSQKSMTFRVAGSSTIYLPIIVK